MKRRLFWKILFAFWLTFLAITQGVWLLLELNRDERRDGRPPEIMAREVTAMALATGRLELAQGGPDAVRAWLDRMPPQMQDRMTVEPAAAKAAGAVAAPDGRLYTLEWEQPRAVPPPQSGPGRGPLRMPWELLLLGILGGLAFSAALAWYLIHPISALRAGFNRLARGEFGVRLAPATGRRRDEIADLGRHFDAMAQRLEQVVSARDKLLHDVSHELRSPLARLQLAIGLARQDPARTELTLHRIEREARRLELLVEELLALARAEHGQPGREDYFDLAEVVSAVADDACFEAEAAGVEIALVTDMPPEDERPLMVGNAELMHRAIDNITRNALRFSKAGQAVDLSVALDARGRRWLVEIADRGPGVEEAALSSIFDPFVRGEDGGSGLGLGLSIASRAVLAHGGTITARNREGGGLAVMLAFPLPA